MSDFINTTPDLQSITQLLLTLSDFVKSTRTFRYKFYSFHYSYSPEEHKNQHNHVCNRP